MQNRDGYPSARPGWRRVFCMSYVHYISKKRVYRKDRTKAFCFFVRCGG